MGSCQKSIFIAINFLINILLHFFVCLVFIYLIIFSLFAILIYLFSHTNIQLSHLPSFVSSFYCLDLLSKFFLFLTSIHLFFFSYTSCDSFEKLSFRNRWIGFFLSFQTFSAIVSTKNSDKTINLLSNCNFSFKELINRAKLPTILE